MARPTEGPSTNNKILSPLLLNMLGRRFLTSDESMLLRCSVFGFLRHYCWLADDAIKSGLGPLWVVRPKFHYFMHVGFIPSGVNVNPRCDQTYVDESFIGRICKVYKGCLNGPMEVTVQNSVSRKWLMGLMADLAIVS